MNFYDILTDTTADDRQSLYATPIIERALRGTVSLEQYLAFLTQAYHHVKHTTALLMACGGRLPERLDWLRTAAAHYIQEEIGHEQWILSDIQVCGGNPEAVRRGRPHTATEVMVAYAYHTVDRGNPVGFFGMVYVLEGTSVALAGRVAETLQSSLGLPPQAFSYLSSHGALDQEHVEFFAGLMDRLTDSRDQAAVVHGARVFYRLYGDIFRALPQADAATREWVVGGMA